MKKILFLVAYLVALASSLVMAQTAGGAEVVVVKTIESPSDMTITTTHGEGKSEEVSVKRIGPVKRIEAVQKVVAQLVQQGYRLQGTSGGVVQDAVIHTTYIFIKGQ